MLVLGASGVRNRAVRSLKVELGLREWCLESPKTGLVILALVVAATLAGGLLGWKIRQQGAALAPKADFPSATLFSREKVRQALPWIQPLQYITRDA
jgi:hypothetical protein